MFLTCLVVTYLYFKFGPIRAQQACHSESKAATYLPSRMSCHRELTGEKTLPTMNFDCLINIFLCLGGLFQPDYVVHHIQKIPGSFLAGNMRVFKLFEPSRYVYYLYISCCFIL